MPHCLSDMANANNILNNLTSYKEIKFEWHLQIMVTEHVILHSQPFANWILKCCNMAEDLNFAQCQRPVWWCESDFVYGIKFRTCTINFCSHVYLFWLLLIISLTIFSLLYLYVWCLSMRHSIPYYVIYSLESLFHLVKLYGIPSSSLPIPAEKLCDSMFVIT